MKVKTKRNLHFLFFFKPLLVFTGPSAGDMFLWMPKEHLYVLVYLVTVMHSMQAGYMEKAQKYTDKALMQIEKLKSNIYPSKSIYFIDFHLQLLETSQSCLFSNLCYSNILSCVGWLWGIRRKPYRKFLRRWLFAGNIPDFLRPMGPNCIRFWGCIL